MVKGGIGKNMNLEDMEWKPEKAERTKLFSIGGGKWNVVLIYEDRCISVCFQNPKTEELLHIHTTDPRLNEVIDGVIYTAKNSKDGVMRFSAYFGNEVRNISKEYWVWLWCQQPEFFRLYDECLRAIHLYYLIDKKSFTLIKMLLEEEVTKYVLQKIEEGVQTYNRTRPTQTV
jgi:hypothetical protein